MSNRNYLRVRHLICLAVLFVQLFQNSAASTQTAAPHAAHVIDMASRKVDPFSQDSGKTVVLLFTAVECPISNSYAPKVRRLYEEFKGKGIVFWLVYCDPDESLKTIEGHRKEFNYPCGALLDTKHELVGQAQARVTPEAAVFDARGKLLYHGRIDDQYAGFGQKRPVATSDDLRLVLNALVENKPLPVSSTKAIGCSISSLK
jgi:thiol-disulfide isomerase/thioredoxin